MFNPQGVQLHTLFRLKANPPMKPRDLSVAVLAAMAAHAAQAAPAVNVNDAATVKVYLSGSSSLRATIAGVMLNDVCGGSAANATTTLYNVAEGSAGFNFTGSHWAITCRLPAAKLGLAANTPIAFFKSDNGGSAQGVFPVFHQTARPFVDAHPSSCTSYSTVDRVYAGCTNITLAIPQFGVSDVQPGMFKGANVPKDPLDALDDNYPDAGLAANELSQLTRRTILQTVFGVAVNDALYAAMFAKQGLANHSTTTGAPCTVASTHENCMPSIGYAELTTFLMGNTTNWRLLVSSGDARLNSQVNICRRVDGAGTQAATNALLLGAGCLPTPTDPAGYTNSSSAAPEAVSALTSRTESGLSMADYLNANMGGTLPDPMPTNSVFVFEGPGTGDVVSCLKRADAGGGYAIGVVSRENDPSSNRWRYVKLEGAAPSRDNLIIGRYTLAMESIMLYRTAYFNTLSAQHQSFISGFIAQIQKPDALAKLSSANQHGVAAMPSAYSGSFDARTGAAAVFGSRVTRNSQSCVPFRATK